MLNLLHHGGLRTLPECRLPSRTQHRQQALASSELSVETTARYHKFFNYRSLTIRSYIPSVNTCDHITQEYPNYNTDWTYDIMLYGLRLKSLLVYVCHNRCVISFRKIKEYRVIKKYGLTL